MATILEGRGARPTTTAVVNLPPEPVCNIEPVTAAELQEYLGGMGFDTDPDPTWVLTEAADGWTLTEGGQS